MDVAVLSGGYNPTGTLTFVPERHGGRYRDRDRERPTESTRLLRAFTVLIGAPGVYQWNAIYSGDSNNNAASDIGDPKEQVVVSP